MEFHILITTNGFEGSWPSIEYGAWLAESLKAKAILLAVNEHPKPVQPDAGHPLEKFCDRAAQLLQARHVEHSLELRNGDAEQIIPMKAGEGEFITVIGPLGRSILRRWLMGRSIRHLMSEISKPIVYVPQARIPLRKLLICIGGLGYGMTAEHFAMQIAESAQAEVTLLHVVPPLELDYPTARIMRSEWQHLVETNTPVGRSLRRAIETAQAAGLTARVVGRQGNVVEEILAEAQEGQYDLLCMGSPYGTNTLRQLYAANVTADIAQSITCPLVTARYKKE